MAFAAGLLVASFFVSIAPPRIFRFSVEKNECDRMRRGKARISDIELQQLREENRRLLREVQMLREFHRDFDGAVDFEQPLPPGGVSDAVPPPPLPPRGPQRPAAGY